MDSSEESREVSSSMAESSSDMVLCLTVATFFCVCLDALEYTGDGGEVYMGDSGITILRLPKAELCL